MGLKYIDERGFKHYDFSELFRTYDFHESDGMLYDSMREGWLMFWAYDKENLEISDYSTLNILYLIKQLRAYSGGNLMISLGGLNERIYESNDSFVHCLLEALKDKIKGIIEVDVYDAINDRCIDGGTLDDVDKFKEIGEIGYYFSTSINIRDRWHKIICETDEVPFSESWLNFMIKIIEDAKRLNEAMLGINIRGTKIKSRLPYLGTNAKYWLRLIPDRWSQTDRLCFIVDFFTCIGELDYRGQNFIDEVKNMSRKEKADMVKSWIDAYDKYILKHFDKGDLWKHPELEWDKY